MVVYKKQKDEEVKKYKEDIEKRERNLQEMLQKSEEEYTRKLTAERNRIHESVEGDLRKKVNH